MDEYTELVESIWGARAEKRGVESQYSGSVSPYEEPSRIRDNRRTFMENLLG